MSVDEDFNSVLGDHLRRLRRQRGLSLLEVEAQSAGEFKASVLGAYERGERAISAQRLSGLAQLYEVPLRAMLPSGSITSAVAPGSLMLDLGRLQESDAVEAKALLRYVRSLQSRRHDWVSGPVISIRSSDILAIASTLGRSPDELMNRLDELKVRIG